MIAAGSSLFMAVLCCSWLAGSASAQSNLALAPARQRSASDDRADESQTENRAAQAARAGMFLPLTEAPRTDSARAFLIALGGYDGAKDAEVLEGRGEVTVYGPLALRIGVLHTAVPNELRPTIGARVQALSQPDHGLDMSIGLFCKPEGFTEGEGAQRSLARCSALTKEPCR